MRRGSGIGFIAVLLAAAVVLILAARAWRAVAPTAQQIVNPAAAGTRHKGPAHGVATAVSDHGDPQAGAAVRSGVLPDLSDMKQGTDQHAKEVQKALEESSH